MHTAPIHVPESAKRARASSAKPAAAAPVPHEILIGPSPALVWGPRDETATAWDAFVVSQPDAALGHLAATRALSLALDGVVDRSLVARAPAANGASGSNGADSDGEIVGVFPLFEATSRVARFLKRRSVVSGALLPAGPLVSSKLKAKDRDALNARFHAAALALAQSSGADEIVVGLPAVVGGRASPDVHPVSPLLEHGYHDAPRPGLLVDLSPTCDALFAQLDSSCRNKIRRCRKDEVGVRQVTDRDEWMRCHAYSQSYDAPNRFSAEFFAIVWDEFIARGRAVAVAVTQDDEILSVVVMSIFAGTSYYWFTFARPGKPATGVNNLALWSGIEAAKERGAKWVELGSLEHGEGKGAAISRFKRAFGGRPLYAWAGRRDLRPARRAALELVQAGVDRVRGFARRSAEPSPSPPSE